MGARLRGVSARAREPDARAFAIEDGVGDEVGAEGVVPAGVVDVGGDVVVDQELLAGGEVDEDEVGDCVRADADGGDQAVAREVVGAAGGAGGQHARFAAVGGEAQEAGGREQVQEAGALEEVEVIGLEVETDALAVGEWGLHTAGEVAQQVGAEQAERTTQRPSGARSLSWRPGGSS